MTTLLLFTRAADVSIWLILMSAADAESCSVGTLRIWPTITSDTPDPSAAGGSVTVSVTVTPSGPGPTGSVSVTDGVDGCVIPLNAGDGGAGSCSLPLSTPGLRTLTATYFGDARYSGSADTDPHQVDQIATTTAVSASPPSPSTAGDAVTFTATVDAATGTPTGTVQFAFDGIDTGTPQALSGGQASIVSTALAVAGSPHTVSAAYSGSGAYAASSGSTSYSVMAPANVPPTASPDAMGPVLEDAGATTLDVISNDSDPDVGDVLAILNASVGAAAHGVASAFSATEVSYAPAADFNGSDAFTYRASDGSAASAVATVSVTVLPVNDAPSFTRGPDVTVSAAAGAVSVPWATGVSAGPPNESGQVVSFSVSTDNDPAFAVTPAVAADGTLTFAPLDPSPAASVTVTVTVQAADDGGTANSGSDQSPAQQFTITIGP